MSDDTDNAQRKARIQAAGSWAALDIGQQVEWFGDDIPDRRIGNISVVQLPDDLDEEHDRALLVTVYTFLNYLPAVADLSAADGKALLEDHNIKSYLKTKYGDWIFDVTGDDWSQGTIGFTLDLTAEEAGGAFPTDITQLTALILDRTQVGQIADDVKSGVFHQWLRELIDAMEEAIKEEMGEEAD